MKCLHWIGRRFDRCCCCGVPEYDDDKPAGVVSTSKTSKVNITNTTGDSSKVTRAQQNRLIKLATKWKVSHFDYYVDRNYEDNKCNNTPVDSRLVSPPFTNAGTINNGDGDGDGEKLSFQLVLLPRDRVPGIGTLSMSLSLELHLLSSPWMKFKARCNLWLVGTEFNMPLIRGKLHNFSLFNESDSVVHYRYFFSHSSLKMYWHELVPKNQLTIYFEVNVLDEWSSHSVQVEKVGKAQVPKSKEAELWQTGRLSDVCLVTGEKKHRVHRSVLAERSPVFAAKLAKVKPYGCLAIDDVSAEVMKELLRFIYTGQVKQLNTMAHQLQLAAERYEVPALKELCLKFNLDRQRGRRKNIELVQPELGINLVDKYLKKGTKKTNESI